MTTTTEKEAGLEPITTEEDAGLAPVFLPLPPLKGIPYAPIVNFPRKDNVDAEVSDQAKEVFVEKPILKDQEVLKSTQQQIHSGRLFYVVGAVVTIAFLISVFQQPNQTQTVLETKPTQETQAQATPEPSQAQATQAQVAQADPEQSAKEESLPDRDPTVNRRNLTISDILDDTKRISDKAPDARARFLHREWQDLAARNPQTYKAYLLGKLRQTNTTALKLTLEQKLSLVGTVDHLNIALSLATDAQAIASELACLNISEGNMKAPPIPLACQNIAVNSPSIGLSRVVKNLQSLEVYEGLLQKAEVEEANERALVLQTQRLQAARPQKPVVGLLNKKP